MPIFEYRCAECEAEFEYLVLQSDESVLCPACGGSRLERLLSLPAVSSEDSKRRAVRAAKAKSRSTRRDAAEAEAARIRAHGDD